MIIFFSVFSLSAASLYYFFSAPDLALAEIAIGSAIIPLVFIITISKQREFLVINHITGQDNFLDYDSALSGKGYKILDAFTKHYNLKLVIKHDDYDELHGIFRVTNVDLVVEKCKKSGKYILKGKKSNLLMSKLEQLTENDRDIDVIRIEEGEMDD